MPPLPPRLSNGAMIDRYRKIILLLDNLRDSEAISLLILTLIAVSRYARLDLIAVVGALIELWEEPLGLAYEDGPPTERMPARSDVN